MRNILVTSNTLAVREIAYLVEACHDNVKRTMETFRPKELITFTQVEEKSTGGRPATVYLVGKRDSYVVVAQLCPEFTARLVDRWQELEELVAQPQAPTLPGDYLSALKALVASAEEKQLLLTANKEMHDELNLLTVQEYGTLTRSRQDPGKIPARSRQDRRFSITPSLWRKSAHEMPSSLQSLCASGQPALSPAMGHGSGWNLTLLAGR